MSCKDVVVALSNDLASERGFVWDVDASIILQESAFVGDSSFVVEGSLDSLVP